MNEGPKDMAAFCMYLDQLLRKGEITNEEERLFVTSLIDPLVEIPVYPLWDPDGNVIGQDVWQTVHAAARVRRTKQEFGMFTQSLIWGADEDNGNQNMKGNTPTQRALKAMILIHLMPGLRTTNTGRKVRLNGDLTGLVPNEPSKDLSAYVWLRRYLTTGTTATNLAEDPGDGIFNRLTQNPIVYGMDMYGHSTTGRSFINELPA